MGWVCTAMWSVLVKIGRIKSLLRMIAITRQIVSPKTTPLLSHMSSEVR